MPTGAGGHMKQCGLSRLSLSAGPVVFSFRILGLGGLSAPAEGDAGPSACLVLRWDLWEGVDLEISPQKASARARRCPTSQLPAAQPPAPVVEVEVVVVVVVLVVVVVARFSSIAASVVDAQAQDVESFAALRASGYKALTPSKPAEVFADSTWFRQLNPIDRTSWAPDLPPAQAGDVETPLQRWKRAEK
eukprot:s4701_g2.t1